MRKEHYFIAILLLFAGVLFGFGSKAGLAIQTALRGDFGQPAPDSANLTASLIPSRANAGLTAPVYSQYPLNLKNQLSIAAGNAEGVLVGDIAMSNGYLVGVVEKTFEHSALVQTVFDKRFQAPVRIGATGADALLRGGNEPELTLIPVDVEVREGDAVYAAADGMPYGAPVGFLRNLRDSGDKVFRQAILSVPYNVGGLDQVTVTHSPKQ